MNRPLKRVRAGAGAWVIAVLLGGCSQSSPPAAPAEKAPVEAPLPASATAVIDTSAGRMTCRLFPQDAPRNIANFIGLAEGTREWRHPLNGSKIHRRLYDGTMFHRVIPGFMVQGGDPEGSGAGGPGYHMNDEISDRHKFDKPGVMALANSGPNTNGSQFFITETPQPHLDGRFTIIGQCDKATVDLVKKIARMPRDSDDRPRDPVRIEKVTIERGS